jgi:outer membrane protein, heavy metal efflux system
MRMLNRSLLSVALFCVVATSLRGQRPISREAAIGAALTRGPLVALLAADTARSSADLVVAAQRFQPNLQASFTEAAPQYHVIAELPLEGALLRGRRLDVARAMQRVARSRYAYDRAALIFDIDTAYTRALSATARASLSRRNAIDADSLRRIAEARRDAGDASELDVQLSTIASGQQANLAALDSVAAISALLDVQTLIGENADTIRISLADTLAPPAMPTIAAGAVGASASVPLRVASARAALDAANAQLALERRSRFGVPSLTAGVEKGDPSGSQPQSLPTVGVAVPIPFPGRNRGVIQVAEAERARVAATLSVIALESQRQIARAMRDRSAAVARVDRDRRLLSTAERVAALALTAYREGASPLPNVLEARRSARDVMAQYIDDVAALWIALAAERLVTQTERP